VNAQVSHLLARRRRQAGSLYGAESTCMMDDHHAQSCQPTHGGSELSSVRSPAASPSLRHASDGKKTAAAAVDNLSSIASAPDAARSALRLGR